MRGRRETKVGFDRLLVPSRSEQGYQQTMQQDSATSPVPPPVPSDDGTLSSSSTPLPPASKPTTPSPAQATRPRRIESRSFSPDRTPWPERSWTYQYRPFRGMWADLKRRAPFYVSDWTEGVKPRNWERVMGATVRMFFLNLCVFSPYSRLFPPSPSVLITCASSRMPCLAYIIDMYVRTGGNYGVNEGILSSAIAALSFSIFSVQPLTIVGVTARMGGSTTEPARH
jgi:hypothetical protein